MRIGKLLFLALFTWSVSLSALQADDINLKTKKLSGTIKSETGKGVMLEGGKELIPAGEIVDIRYTMKFDDPASEFYSPAFIKETTLDKVKDRRDTMLDIVKLYKKALDKMPKDANPPFARRNVEFRIAYLGGRLAAEFGIAPNTAMGDLKSFKDRHPNSWQISQCLQKLAEVQMSEKKIAEAEKTYTELGQAQVAEEVKQEAEFLAGKLTMQIGNYAQALAKFQALVAKLPKNSPVAIQATVAQTECLALSGKTEEANKLLKGLLKDSTDRDLKALAHNALGKNLFEQKKFKEARWEFLWVDVVYNQNRAEHAKSLYFLWKSFRELNENERAQECYETLTSEPFAGTEFQRKALAETKK